MTFLNTHHKVVKYVNPEIRFRGSSIQKDLAALREEFESGVNSGGLGKGNLLVVEKEQYFSIFVSTFGDAYHILIPFKHEGKYVMGFHHTNLKNHFEQYKKKFDPRLQRNSNFAIDLDSHQLHKAAGMEVKGVMLLVRAEDVVDGVGFLASKEGEFLSALTLIELHPSPIKREDNVAVARDWAGSFGECNQFKCVQIFRTSYSDGLDAKYHSPRKSNLEGDQGHADDVPPFMIETRRPSKIIEEDEFQEDEGEGVGEGYGGKGGGEEVDGEDDYRYEPAEKIYAD